MEKIKIRITLQEEMLGTSPNEREIFEKFVSSKADTLEKQAEESEAMVEIDKPGETVFARDKNGEPVMWDYQIKGFFKDACYMLSRAVGERSAPLKWTYKKIIDGMVFVMPRQIKLNMPVGGSIGTCQRPLRAETMRGERIALAKSESVPAGTTLDLEILWMPMGGTKKKEGADLKACIEDWLNYGALRGLGQWRNSGKGRFTWEIIE